MQEGNVKQTDLRLTKGQQIIEILRPWVLLAFYIAFAYFGLWWLAVPAALATCLAAFVQLHDSIHNALGLSKKGHDRLLISGGFYCVIPSEVEGTYKASF